MKTKKLKFSFNTDNLTSIKISPDRQKDIMYEIFQTANLFTKVNLLTGIKSGDYIPLMSITPSFAAGGCGYSDNNAIALSDKQLTTKLLKSDLTMCPSSLAGSVFEVYLPEGANEQDFTTEELIVMYLKQKYAKAIQNMCLTGTTGASSIDGLITLAYASSSVVEVEGTAPTTSDALDKLFAIYSAMNDGSLTAEAEPIIIVGNDWLRKASLQSYNDNRVMYNFVIDEQNGFTLPTTNVRVQGYDVLNSTNKALAGSSKYMVLGTDLEDDMSTVDVWYSRDNKEIRSRIQFRIGAALLFESTLRRYKVTS